jgi:16S rRNA (guanine(966)-N(2))-methyltransferase RsmD
MRIIGGTLGGRKFYPPAKGWPTRPTTDVAKEALYNILQGKIEFSEVRFLDLFGGTGSHSFEMISRGCTDVTYVDSYRPCCEFVRKTASELEIVEFIRIFCKDVFRYCAGRPGTFDLIFAGPPYGLKNLSAIPAVIFDNGMLAEDGLLVVEHNAENDFTQAPHFLEIRKYGETQFSFFEERG